MPDFQTYLARAAALTALSLALLWTPAATAQQSIGRIVASVNDDAITDFDVESRARLIAVSSGVDLTPEVSRRVGQDALRELIDDRLKIQEAKRLQITVNDQEVGAAISTIERSNNMASGALMAELTTKNVPVETLIDQVKATLLWRKVLRRVVLPQVAVATEEVNDALARIRDAGGASIMRAAEIFLPARTDAEFADAKRRAGEIQDLATDTAKFSRLAAQYSRAPTAAVGGDLGEVQPGQLSPELEEALQELQPGETSAPVVHDNGVYLLHLLARRQIEQGEETSAVVTLARAFVAVPSNEDSTAVGRALANVTAGVDGCDAFERAAERAYGRQPARVVDARIGDLPDQIRDQTAALAPGGQTEPIPLSDGVAVFMLCRRTEVGGSLPSADRVAERIQNQRAARRADRYLRDLRRVAFIDIRG